MARHSEAADATPEPGIALAAILQGLVADTTRDRLSFADIIAAMGERAFGPLLVVFALPNILPAPPGTAGIMAIPLIFLTVQMVLARRPWLPGFLSRRSVSRTSFARFVDRATPWLARAARFLRPRFGVFVRPLSERLIGLICLLLALVLLLPIPFANSTPALAICLFGFGLLERDGVWIMSGLIVAGAAVALASWLGFAVIQAGIAIAQHFLF